MSEAFEKFDKYHLEESILDVGAASMTSVLVNTKYPLLKFKDAFAKFGGIVSGLSVNVIPYCCLFGFVPISRRASASKSSKMAVPSPPGVFEIRIPSVLWYSLHHLILTCVS